MTKIFTVDNPSESAHTAAKRAAFNTGTSKIVNENNPNNVKVYDWDEKLLAIFVSS